LDKFTEFHDDPPEKMAIHYPIEADVVSTSERSSPRRLVVVRHGRVVPEVHGRFVGVTDAPLSEEGAADVRRLAPALTGLSPTRVFVSPLARARRTLAELGRGWADEALIEPRVRELDMGRLEGRRPDEVARLEPDFYQVWRADPGAARFPEGESVAGLTARVAQWVEAQRSAPDGDVLLVTHLFVLFALLNHLSGFEWRRIRGLFVHTASVSLWSLGPAAGADRLELLNWRPTPLEET
jgi:broad specificity phosphatase PhoE